jgi:Holliday junction resolvase-like predicted endonuclease
MLENDGKIAEAKAITHFISTGHEIFLPFGGCGSCDFIAVKDGNTLRVEVKSTRTKDVGTSHTRVIALRRAKSSKQPRTKFDSTKSDLVYITNLTTGLHKMYDSSELEGRTRIRI